MNIPLEDRFELYIFDLDNTLYVEEKYLVPAYECISEWLAKRESLNRYEIFTFLKDTFYREGRDGLFNKMESKFNLKYSHISSYLRILRTIKLPNNIEVQPVMSDLLSLLDRKQKKIVILTNGNPEQQQNKINQISWPIPIRNIEIILANSIEPKPSPKCVDLIKRKWGQRLKKYVLIGDSEIDKQTAVNSHISFLWAQDLNFTEKNASNK